MDATWNYARRPTDFTAASDVILQAMLEVFATIYSLGIQDSMYRMGCAALKEVAENSAVKMVIPNKHHTPMNLLAFRLDHPNVVFSPTEEPHA